MPDHKHAGIELFDTYERRIRPFEPLVPGEVGLYACGPTVYDFAHIGNLRTYVFEDLLRRTLERNGYAVNHVMNITDVGHLTSDEDSGDDKMEVGSRRTGKTAWEIAAKYADAFQADLAALNISPPVTWCRATDHIPEQIEFVEDLVNKGFTYKTDDGVYFNSQMLNSYGYLARRDLEGLQGGARVEQGGKKAITDFALWKFSPAGTQRQMEWDSPWGRGFPGWHIECSAMSAKYLGDYFDIHCGGEDHISVHHTNEIAQTEARCGTRLANFWMHGYFLQQDKSKMSKSGGGFLRLETLQEEGYEPLDYRYLTLTAHYRSHLEFSWDNLKAAAVARRRLMEAAWEWGDPGAVSVEFRDRFTALVNRDLGLPEALALAWELKASDVADSSKRATLIDFDEVLGLDVATWEPVNTEIPDAVVALVRQRDEARAAKDYALADHLRAEVDALGFVVEDSRDGSVARPKE
jgi:cysteinyl-tRNA synthetase